jgi:hypothetical protein
LDLKGSYRLGERHQERPAKSRYDRRPQLKKRRICTYSTVNARFRQGAFAARADQASGQLRGGARLVDSAIHVRRRFVPGRDKKTRGAPGASRPQLSESALLIDVRVMARKENQSWWQGSWL